MGMEEMETTLLWVWGLRSRIIVLKLGSRLQDLELEISGFEFGRLRI